MNQSSSSDTITYFPDDTRLYSGRKTSTTPSMSAFSNAFHSISTWMSANPLIAPPQLSKLTVIRLHLILRLICSLCQESRFHSRLITIRFPPSVKSVSITFGTFVACGLPLNLQNHRHNGDRTVRRPHILCSICVHSFGAGFELSLLAGKISLAHGRP